MLGTFPRHSEAKRILIDIETYDPLLKTKGVSYTYNQGYILGIGIKLDNALSQYYPLNHVRGENYDIDQVTNYIRDIPDTATVGGHYFIYDAGWLHNESTWLHKGQYLDTLLLAQLENNTRPAYSLEKLSQHFGIGHKVEMDTDEIYKKSIEEVSIYCCQDLDLTAGLDNHLWKIRDEAASHREFALIPILVKMKEKGIKIDVEALETIEATFTEELQHQLYLYGSNDIWASKKIAQVFDGLNISYPRTAPSRVFPDGNPSFPHWFLDSIDHPTVKALFKARQLHRLINTFCSGIKEHLSSENRLHTDFFNGRSEFGGTITGRFSSAHPNLQQIPNRTEEGKLLRSLFIPDEGYFLCKFDYKQQEPMLMLHYASKLNLRDIDKWKKIYQDPKADFYIPIQSAMKIERFPAKTISLARSYGMGPEKLSRMMHIGMREAIEYLMGFDGAVPWLKELKDQATDTAIRRGHILTIGGRKLFFTRSDANRAFNHLIQGSAADQTKQAMINIYSNLGLVPLLQVHDELLYQLNEEEVNKLVDETVEVLMSEAIKLDFPVRVDRKIGMNWLQCA